MKKQKILTIIGLVLSLALIITGIVILNQDANWRMLSSGEEEATAFGADFYTYIYDSANNIANNTFSAAKIQLSIFSIVQLCFGLAFIFAGLFSALHFAKDESLVFKKENAPVAAEPAAEVPSAECEEAVAEAVEEKAE